MRANVIIAGGLLLFGAIVIASLRPIQSQLDKGSIIEQGVISDMYESGITDVVVKLQGQAKKYYISNMLDGVSMDQLKGKLMNKKVIIEYPDKWTPMNGKNSSHYISKLEHEGEIIYSDDEDLE